MQHEECLPDFLGIGSARCGTTWLHYNLLEHPDVWLPWIKELHYFDRSCEYPSPSHLATDRFLGRLFGRQEQNRKWRAHAVITLRRAGLHQPSALPWTLRYLCGRYGDRWYASLFKPGRDKIRGEITPGYAILRVRDIARIHSLMPRVKLILLLRNPLDRIWSACRRKHVTESEIRTRLDDPGLDERSDYRSILSNWRSVFPSEQLQVEFYDEIKLNPQELLKRVCRFIGASDADRYVSAEARKVHNPSPERPMPPDLRLALARKYEPQLAELSAALGGHATRWLEDVRATLRQGGAHKAA